MSASPATADAVRRGRAAGRQRHTDPFARAGPVRYAAVTAITPALPSGPGGPTEPEVDLLLAPREGVPPVVVTSAALSEAVARFAAGTGPKPLSPVLE